MPATRTKRPTPKRRRDTTRALQIVKRTSWVRDVKGTFYRGLSLARFNTLVQILTDIDARETKRDPHLRRKR